MIILDFKQLPVFNSITLILLSRKKSNSSNSIPKVTAKKTKKKDPTELLDYPKTLPKRDLAAKFFGEYLKNDVYKD